MIARETLSEIIRIQNEIGNVGSDLSEAMNLVAEGVLNIVDAHSAVIRLAEGEDMVCRSAAGLLRDQVGLRTSRKGSLSGLCVQTGASELRYGAEPYPSLDTQAAHSMRGRSYMAVPLKMGEVTVGALEVESSEPSGFNEMDVALLELISGLLTSSIGFASEYNIDKLFHLATHDRLTGISNRSHFLDRLDHAIEQSERARSPIAVLRIDMDGLGIINDKYGRSVGDAILIEYASCLRSVVRATDMVARIDGDEFALLLNPVNVPHGIETAVRRIQNESAYPFLYDGTMYILRASIGAAHFPEEAEDIDNLLDLAEQRMLAAKEEKKQGKSIFQPLADF